MDLFFVLSGFLIGRILLKEVSSENYYQVFYVRRMCRIFPLYYINIVLFVILLKTCGPSLSNWLFKNPAPLFSYATFTQNIFFDPQNMWAFWLAPTWSLAVEEQFYLVLPVIIRRCSERRLLLVLIGTIVAAPICRALCIYWHPDGPLAGDSLGQMLMVTRADSLMMGVLVAWLFREQFFREQIVARQQWLYVVLLILAGGMGVLTIKYPDAGTYARIFPFTWIALFYTLILILTLSHREGWIGTILRNRILLSLGTTSYCVYLIHNPILGLCHGIFFGNDPQISNLPELLVTAFALCVTLMTARISWVCLERPVLQLGHTFSYGIRQEQERVGKTQGVTTT